MVRLQYKSLVTNETVNYYLSVLKHEQEKKDFMKIVLTFDIKISTEPVIKGDEFFYKIWILKRGTKKRAHIKQYYSLDSLQEKKFNEPIHPISLEQILWMIRINADVPDDFEEYCEIHLTDPSDPICRSDYEDNLRRAARFKKFMTQDEIRAFPFSIEGDENDEDEEYDNNQQKEGVDFIHEYNLELPGYSTIFLNDIKEYDKLSELQNTLDYYEKIVRSYGFDIYTCEFNHKVFPITKEDEQIKTISNNIDNYFEVLREYDEYLKVLIKKYNIRPSGNTLKRVAFNIKNRENNKMSKYRPIFTAINYKTF